MNIDLSGLAARLVMRTHGPVVYGIRPARLGALDTPVRRAGPPALFALIVLALALWIATAPASPPIRDQYEAFPPVRIVHAPWLRILPHKDGLTIGRVIFYRDPTPRPYLLAHEYSHARQYQRHGTVAFLRSYLRHPAALELDARRDTYPTCAELSDVVPAAICAGVVVAPMR